MLTPYLLQLMEGFINQQMLENPGRLIGGSDLCDDEDAGGNCHYHGIVVEKEAPFKVLVGSGGDQYAKEGVGLTGSEDNGESWRNSDDGFVRDVHVSKLIIDPNNSNVFYATTQGRQNIQTKLVMEQGCLKALIVATTGLKLIMD